MPSGKTVKLVLYEVLQFAALIIPVFVVMEKFAIIIHDVKGQDLTAYWLVVAISIAYMTSVTLLVWVLLKYLVLKQRITTQWRPTALVYIILCTFPCFALIITSSKVQVDSGQRSDQFTELPVSLVLFSLICVDIIERIRPCRLTGQSDSLDPDVNMPYPILTHLEQVITVSGQLHSDETQNSLSQSLPETRNGRISGRWQDNTASPNPSTLSSRAPSTAYLYSSSSWPRSYSGRLGFLWRRDERSQVFVDSFLFWLDTVEMVRVAGEPPVFYSAWVFPIYIFAFLSTIRMAITPNSPLLSSAGVALQDLPFFIIRFALLIVFGYVTPVLYPLKNALVSLTFVYFIFLSKRTRSMF